MRGTSNISGYFKALGAMEQEDHGRLSILESTTTLSGSCIDGVNMDGHTVPSSSGVAMSVKLAQTCVCAVGFVMAPFVHMCRDNEVFDSARTIRAFDSARLSRYGTRRARSAVFTLSQLQHPRGSCIDGVNIER